MPIFIDQCVYRFLTYPAFEQFASQFVSSAIRSKKAYKTASWIGGVSLIVFCPSLRLGFAASCLYLAYKTAHYFIRKKQSPPESPAMTTPPLQVHPSMAQLGTQVTAFFAILKATSSSYIDRESPKLDNSISHYPAHYRDRWNEPVVMEAMSKLMESLSEILEKLFDDLKTATSYLSRYPEAQHQEMARLLLRPDAPHCFLDRFFGLTHLNIYRFVRGMDHKIVLTLVPEENQPIFVPLDKLLDEKEDGFPFWQEGTAQCKWREIYNQTILLVAPTLKYTPHHIAQWDNINNSIPPEKSNRKPKLVSPHRSPHRVRRSVSSPSLPSGSTEHVDFPTHR